MLLHSNIFIVHKSIEMLSPVTSLSHYDSCSDTRQYASSKNVRATPANALALALVFSL